MSAYVLFSLFFIVQKSASLPCCSVDDYWFYTTEDHIHSEETTAKGQQYSDVCSEEDQSLLSENDIKYSVEDIATKLQVLENLINNHYPDAIKIHEQYLDELEDIQNRLVDRPKHMLHILDDIINLRQKLEPSVEKIEAQLQEFQIHKEEYEEIAELSDDMLKQINKYKKLCQINCEDSNIKTRLGQKRAISNPLLKYNAHNNKYCITLRDLNEYITARLIQFQEEYDQELFYDVENIGENHAQKLRDLKINLKEAAVKQFGMTMYDILSLQDDYYHFAQELNNIYISTDIDNIEVNSAEIKFKLIGLKHDLGKYKKYCVNCKSERRVKRDVFGLQEEWREDSEDSDVSDVSDVSGVSDEENVSNESNILDELINAKIDEIKNIITRNYTDLFSDLDADFNDPEVFNPYLRQLQPIQDEIDLDIQMEQEAFYELQDRVPQLLLDDIHALAQESKQIKLDLDEAKQFIDKFI